MKGLNQSVRGPGWADTSTAVGGRAGVAEAWPRGGLGDVTERMSGGLDFRRGMLARPWMTLYTACVSGIKDDLTFGF